MGLICPSSHAYGPYLVGGRAIVGHMVPGGHQSPGGRVGDGGEVLVDVLGDEGQQCRVSGLSVEDISSKHVVHIGPIWGHKGASISQWEGVWGVLVDPGVKGDHPVVVDLEKTSGQPQRGGHLLWSPINTLAMVAWSWDPDVVLPLDLHDHA